MRNYHKKQLEMIKAKGKKLDCAMEQILFKQNRLKNSCPKYPNAITQC